MGALKVWTGSQWTEAGGGLRDVPAGVIMAEATRNAAVQSVTGGVWTKLTLDTSIRDTDGIFDDANDRFTIPAGMGGAWHFEARTFITAATYVQLAIYKNGADWRRIYEVRGSSSEFVGPITVTDPDASPGDYYEIYAYSAATEDFGNATVESAYTRFTAYKLGSGGVGEIIGAKASEESAQSLATATNVDVTFDTVEFDSDGFTDIGGASDEFTIPAGLAGKYLAVGGTEFAANSTGYRRLLIGINGTATETIAHDGVPTAGDVTRISGSAILDLAAGDVVTLMARQTSGGNLNIGSVATGRSHFALVLLATQGSGGLKEGTVFPVSPTTGDRYRRTDLDYMVFFYDGTRWLSEQVFRDQFTGWVSSDAFLTYGGSTTSGLDVYCIDVDANVAVAVTNNGSNYWRLRFYKNDLGGGNGGVTQVGGDYATTASDTAGVSVDHSFAMGETMDVSAYPSWGVYATKTGSPGVLRAYGQLNYRLIAT